MKCPGFLPISDSPEREPRYKSRSIASLAPKSVKKKLKDKSFAAAVSREDIRRGIEELGVDPAEHIQIAIDALREEAERLGLQGGG